MDSYNNAFAHAATIWKRVHALRVLTGNVYHVSRSTEAPQWRVFIEYWRVCKAAEHEFPGAQELLEFLNQKIIESLPINEE